MIQQDFFMSVALNESRKALPKCFPNPPVGSVIVCNNKIIAKGHTQQPGKPHAEPSALNQINKEMFSNLDLDLYVTLEPCSFYGRTPSCAHTIVSDGRIKRMYVAMLDPDPRNNGKGIEILKKNNIEVNLFILQRKVSAFLSQYLKSST